MSNTSVSERPVWVIPAIGFLVGLLVGWWLIGWWLLPVTWTNALPVDLRAAERDEYIGMVAESYRPAATARWRGSVCPASRRRSFRSTWRTCRCGRRRMRSRPVR